MRMADDRVTERVAVLEANRAGDILLLHELRDDMRSVKDDSLPKMREALELHRRESGEHWAKVRGALWVVGVVWVLLSAAIPLLMRFTVGGR
jgi:hypothetical protein